MKIVFAALFTIFLVGQSALVAQMAIQLEKAGSFKTTKFFVGDQLVYKLKNDTKHWLKARIERIHIEEGLISFENRSVKLVDIYAIRTSADYRWAKSISDGLTTFSVAWTFWTLVSLAYGDPLAVGTVIVGVGSFAIAKLLKFLFYKTHIIKRNKRLRLIDLTFYKLPVQKRT